MWLCTHVNVRGVRDALASGTVEDIGGWGREEIDERDDDEE